MKELVKKIRSRGYWEVIIRPSKFEEKKLPVITALYPIIERASVKLRGWDFPHVDLRSKGQIDNDWVGQEYQGQPYPEVWRFYQSGQFFGISGMIEDWVDPSAFGPPSEDWRHGSFLSVEGVVFRFTEIFEFAARLALTNSGDEQIHLSIIVGCIQARSLWVNPAHRAGSTMFAGKTASIQEFHYPDQLPRAQMISNARELSLKPALELFRRFDWDPSVDLLREIQSKLLQHV